MAKVVLLGTCDTKLQELLFLRKRIERNGTAKVILVDVGRSPAKHSGIDITQDELVSRYGSGPMPADLPRDQVVRVMSECATRFVQDLHSTGGVDGIIAAGGSGGTSLAAAVMRDAVPIGLPKLIVSTIASGDTGPLVGETDITMMYSVVDIAGLNQVLEGVFRNAGAAIAAAAASYAETKGGSEPSQGAASTKKRIGITMFGVTTPGVDAIRRHLESNYNAEVYVFHATGHGGKAMERLVREGRLDAVLDLTTTEICDEITGGNMSAGPGRLQAAAEAGIPNVVSLGATDMSNFGPRSTVPTKYDERKLYKHNPVVTLMRSSKEENSLVAQFICTKLRACSNPEMVEVWIPRGGVSMISTPGGPFADQEADGHLFTEVTDGLKHTGIKVVDDPRDVNDPGFAKDIAEALAAKIWKNE
ncbi:hypothetical protein S40285_07779 [Stachybotrys chlorohalonatus IBT 40285]|uniref:Uncharacterized protein n=1 Tax=Stachybotrys chlorohalonatus (strain IBT 40285) TaxID=1283841 RepID=A0A084QIM7_STAC4|nr:hypothetical protein S40285_07779 [Stachybotrys chlorohalonata IBT 40285]